MARRNIVGRGSFRTLPNPGICSTYKFYQPCVMMMMVILLGPNDDSVALSDGSVVYVWSDGNSVGANSL